MNPTLPFLSEVQRFKAWASQYPARHGEWECDYEHWNCLYPAVTDFVEAKPLSLWSGEELSAVLYAVARDNEMQYLAKSFAERVPEILLDLAEASLERGEPDAKWQIAEQLRYVDYELDRRERLLLKFADDEHEYVRRRALQTLARVDSPATERVAIQAWSRPDELQQWARMMSLWALHRVRSNKLEAFLAAAEQDGRPYLVAVAAKIRSGDVDDA